MIPFAVDTVALATIVASTAYVVSAVPAFWRQYPGAYRRPLLGFSLVSLLFGAAHIGELYSLPGASLALVEIGAQTGFFVVVLWFVRIHPRPRPVGGENR
jgi:hypothetical protein